MEREVPALKGYLVWQNWYSQGLSNHTTSDATVIRFYYLQGVNLVQELISDYGLNVVQAYMNHIQVC